MPGVILLHYGFVCYERTPTDRGPPPPQQQAELLALAPWCPPPWLLAGPAAGQLPALVTGESPLCRAPAVTTASGK
jgi:hypothetical protein